jgi:hypothetical protein
MQILSSDRLMVWDPTSKHLGKRNALSITPVLTECCPSGKEFSATAQLQARFQDQFAPFLDHGSSGATQYACAARLCTFKREVKQPPRQQAAWRPRRLGVTKAELLRH